MQKPPEVPDRKPEKSDRLNLEGTDNDLIARFEICLGQILRLAGCGSARARAERQVDAVGGRLGVIDKNNDDLQLSVPMAEHRKLGKPRSRGRPPNADK
jgi:hypothetical protein